MANTLTNLAPDLYESMDVVSREMVGMIPAVSHDMSTERAALNQTIRSFATPSATLYDVTPGQLPADNGDQTINNITMTISRAKYAPVRWNGEEQLGVNSGPGYRNVLQDQIKQAMRALVNYVEADLTSLFYQSARAAKPFGTTLFDAANYRDVADVRQILVDNGAPVDDLHLILNTKAGAALRGLAQYTGALEAGTTEILRQGILLDVHGVAMRESAQIKTQVVGTGSSATTDNAGYAIGSTTITLASAGTGTILAGDTITFATDANNIYVVKTGSSDVSSGGTVVLNAPGLRQALSAATHVITVSTTTDKNMAFSRNAIHLVTRAPARPTEGDMAEDVMIIQDPKSGLAFEVAYYKQYRQVKYEIALAWGYQVIKPEHLALLTQ